ELVHDDEGRAICHRSERAMFTISGPNSCGTDTEGLPQMFQQRTVVPTCDRCRASTGVATRPGGSGNALSGRVETLEVSSTCWRCQLRGASVYLQVLPLRHDRP